jgi:methylated-DNA-[protein]-cysteine S-methyltransferase
MTILQPSAIVFHQVFGIINLFMDPDGVYKLTFSPHVNFVNDQTTEPRVISDSGGESLKYAIELLRYLTGKGTSLDIPINWSIFQSFQRTVLEHAYKISFGTIMTYGQLANHMGNINNSRAVGAALGKNPIPIIIPCHRVIGANGSLHGYSAPGGLSTKAWLLTLEGHYFSPDSPIRLEKDKYGNFK